MNDEPQYVFEMSYVLARDDPYFYVRWDKAKTAAVVAPTRDEAFTELWALLGEPDMHFHWTAKILSVRDLRAVQEARRER